MCCARARITNEKKIELSGDSLGEILDKLIEKYGNPLNNLLFEESGELNRFIKFYVNGRDVLELERDHPLNEDDEISILIVIGGG